MNLTPHFTLAEMTASETAARRGIDNTPSDAIIANLRRIAAKLEEIRALTGRPIVVSSGYRCPKLNEAVGGARNSDHVKGLAADINCYPYTPYELGKLIIGAGITFSQMIQEGTWLHIAVPAEGVNPKRELLTAKFGPNGTSYRAGWLQA